MAFLFNVFLLILHFLTGSTEFINIQHTDNLNINISDNKSYIEENDLIKDILNVSNHPKFQTSYSFGERKKTKLDWWQTSVIYEIYPRSFKDTTGNGIGDLRGIIEKIPYLKEIGIDAVWLTPIFSSPGYDFGYDIKDYRKIDELMGTMDDFDELLTKLHENGIRILLDFVPNHTSDQHEWFVKSVQKIEPYTDYYVWADPKYINGTRQVPNNWVSYFGGSVWEWNEQRQQYYLHQFHKQQVDLNYWNPLVHEEMKNLLRFWLDKGVDGFRCDAVQCLYERQDLKDVPFDSRGQQQKVGYIRALNESFEIVKEWRAVLDEYKKKDGVTRLIVVESYLKIEKEKKYYGNSTHPGNHFPLSATLLFLFQNETAKSYVDILTNFLQELPPNAWESWIIGNHDFGRPTTHFGNELVDGIFMMQLLLPGTPVVYMGDELGMTDSCLRKDQLVDHWSKNGGVLHRENFRTPFQWDSTAQAGFSYKTKTWLPVNPNYVTVNVDTEKNAALSHLIIFKELVKLRQLEVFRSGDVNFYEVSKYVFAFSRSNSFFKSYFVVLNLGSEMENVNLRKVKAFLPSKMKVNVASLQAEQKIGDFVHSKSFALRPKAALVLESSFGYF